MSIQYEKEVDRAIAWSHNHIHSTAYTMRCLAFVEDAFERSNNIEMFGGDSAAESAELYEASRNKEAPPKGAFVFYACCGPVDGEIKHWGHVGLALEGGLVIHAWDKVRVDHYMDIEQLSAAPGWSRPSFIGWTPVERLLSETRERNWAAPFAIECKDIILREFGPQDLDALYELTWQPEIAEFLPDWSVSKEQRVEWLLNYEIPENKHFLQNVAGGFSIEGLRLRLGIISRESGEFIGWCCTGPKDGLPAPGREVMYAISSEHRNKGYTTQAVKGLCQYLFEYTDAVELGAVALPHNIPSNKVIRKSGFTFLNMIELEGEQYNHYKLHKRT